MWGLEMDIGEVEQQHDAIVARGTESLRAGIRSPAGPDGGRTPGRAGVGLPTIVHDARLPVFQRAPDSTASAALAKNPREHRVPLCDRAVEVRLQARTHGEGTGLAGRGAEESRTRGHRGRSRTRRQEPPRRSASSGANVAGSAVQSRPVEIRCRQHRFDGPTGLAASASTARRRTAVGMSDARRHRPFRVGSG